MNVYVCRVAPYSSQKEVQGKIGSFNDHLAEWGETNGIAVIDTVPTVSLGTGELDDLCFNKETDSNSSLNRLGATKLLTINNGHGPQLKLCPDCEVKRKTYTYTEQAKKHRSTGQGNTKTSLAATSLDRWQAYPSNAFSLACFTTLIIPTLLVLAVHCPPLTNVHCHCPITAPAVSY